jgi:hypothetical protein
VEPENLLNQYLFRRGRASTIYKTMKHVDEVIDVVRRHFGFELDHDDRDEREVERARASSFISAGDPVIDEEVSEPDDFRVVVPIKVDLSPTIDVDMSWLDDGPIVVTTDMAFWYRRGDLSRFDWLRVTHNGSATPPNVVVGNDIRRITDELERKFGELGAQRTEKQ